MLRLITGLAFVTGTIALPGCVVTPVVPAYGYGYRVPPRPAVVVVPRPYYGYRDGYRDWKMDPYR